MIEKLSRIKGHWRLEIKADDVSCEVDLFVDRMEEITVISYERDINWALETAIQEYEKVRGKP